MRELVKASVLCLATFGVASTGFASEPSGNVGEKTWLAAVEKEAARDEAGAKVPPAPAGWKKPVPIKLSLAYTLVSDYIFRGLNFSEYRGEGREKPNHQLSVGVEVDTADLGFNVGQFGATFWFEWYAAQNKLTPGCNDHLQEVDYTVYWRYNFKPIYTTVEAGWLAYTYPQVPQGSDARYTHEWYVKLIGDDRWLWGTEEPVLNPYIAYFDDMDDVYGGVVMGGISHPFPLAKLGMAEMPFFKDIAVIPSVDLIFDHRTAYSPARNLGRQDRWACVHLCLAVNYNLSSALGIPEEFGKLGITGFLAYAQIINDTLREKWANDEFYGGVTVGYEW